MKSGDVVYALLRADTGEVENFGTPMLADSFGALRMSMIMSGVEPEEVVKERKYKLQRFKLVPVEE